MIWSDSRRGSWSCANYIQEISELHTVLHARRDFLCSKGKLEWAATVVRQAGQLRPVNPPLDGFVYWPWPIRVYSKSVFYVHARQSMHVSFPTGTQDPLTIAPYKKWAARARDGIRRACREYGNEPVQESTREWDPFKLRLGKRKEDRCCIWFDSRGIVETWLELFMVLHEVCIFPPACCLSWLV